MKIDELRKAIRGLIKEEVKKAVAEEVSKAMGKILVEVLKEVKSNNSSPNFIEDSEEELTPTPIHTNNPKLNSVLAETARHFKPLPKTADMSTGFAAMMEGDFEKIGKGENTSVGEPATKMDFLKQMVSQTPSVVNQPSALDGGSEVPDILKKVFKKDFRAVMKKIDEQKKNGGGGYIDPSRVLTG
jgi:hypothetical protein